MAYQQVGTPRFYINLIEWEGLATDPLFRTLPVNPKTVAGEAYLLGSESEGVKINGLTEKNFVAVLGHNYISGSAHQFEIYQGGVNPLDFSTNGNNPLVNWYTGATAVQNYTNFDGFSIAEINNPIEDNSISFYQATPDDWGLKIGSIVIGSYYEMPHSPDLQLSLSYDYSGIKEITTRGGATLSNTFYSKPPMWGDLGAWELGDGSENQNLSRSGRRIWDLSFSFLSQEDTFPKYDKLTTIETDDEPTDYAGETDDSRQYTLQGSDDFYTQVIHKTNGGQLPFIFQPNKDDNTNFAIAKIDSGFTFKQVANGVYNVKMKIREVW